MNEPIARPRLIPRNAETDWTRHWELALRSRWVEKGGKLYPRGTAPERMNDRDDYPPPPPRPPRLEHAATWRPRKA